jgi:hypothetical protein
MATNASPFIVNILDLQNIATGIAGTSSNASIAKVQADIGNIQEMVNYQTRTISADILTSFTNGRTIDVMANLNLSNASLYTNSNLVTLNTASRLKLQTTHLSTLGETGTQIYVNSTLQSISFTTAGVQSFLIDASGNANFSKNVYIGGNAYVTNLIQTSDSEFKINVEPFRTTVEEVLKLAPQTFEWLKTGTSDIGFIAQDVKTAWPSLTETHPDGTMGLVYSRFIPLLIESIRELNSRVLSLESRIKTI